MTGKLANEKRQAFDAVLGTIRKHQSIASHPNAEDFALEIADKVAAVHAQQTPLRESLKRELPPGWHLREKAASNAMLNLARTLEAMQPEERKRWVPPSETLAEWAGTKPDIKLFENGLTIDGGTPIPEDRYYEALQLWVRVAIEMASSIEFRKATPKPKRSQMLPRKFQIRHHVQEIARAWATHFGSAPAASGNSPFTETIQVFYELIDISPPSHPTIKAALENNEPGYFGWSST